MSRSAGRVATALALALTVVGAGSALAAPRPLVLGPNLAPNPSFEQSTSDAATANGIPVLPVGWSVEGSSLLFDYNQRGGHTGKRNAAINQALGGGTQVCDGSSGSDVCAPNPAYSGTHAVDDATVGTFSVRPFWTTAKPIPVKAGQRYRFSVWAIRPSLNPNAGVAGEGAQTRVRWVNSSGAAISVVNGAALLKGPKRQLGFKLISADLVAPAGATGAVLMLGHTDYTHTGAAVAFDDVSFQKLG